MSASVTYTILAGPDKQPLVVPKHVLEKSSVIRDWIEDPTTISSSLVHEGALNLSEIEPDVVTTVIKWLEKSANLPAARRLEYALEDVALGSSGSTTSGRHAIFYVKMYKLGLCLALDDLCTQLLLSLRRRTHTIQTFIDIALHAEKARLIDEHRFRAWTVDYITRNSEKLLESGVLRTTIQSGGDSAWRFCSLLMSSLAQCRLESVSAEEAATATTALLTPEVSPAPKPKDFLTPDRTPSAQRESVPRESVHRESVHRETVHRKSKAPAAPNSKKARASYGDSPGNPRKRSYNATVEDANEDSS